MGMEEKWDNLSALLDVIEDEGYHVINFINLFIMDEIGMEELSKLKRCAEYVRETIEDFAWPDDLPEMPEEFYEHTATMESQLMKMIEAIKTTTHILNLKIKLLHLLHDYQHARERLIEIAENIYAKREINP